MGGMLGASVPSGRQLSYSGTIQSAEKATVTSPLAGSVVEVFVKDGDTVRAGQRLLRLTPLASGRQPVVVSAPLSGLIVASLEGIESSDPALDVLVRFPHVGMRTEAGMPLFDIVNEKSAVIPLNVPERDIVYVKPGQEVTIRPRVLPRVTLRGKVVRVARAGQSRMTNGVRATVFPVTVQVLDSLDRARLGMTADVVWVEEVKDEEATQEASPPPTPTGRGG